MKLAYVFGSCVLVYLLFMGAIWGWMQWHTIVLEYRDVMSAKAVEMQHHPGLTVVRISGFSGNSAYCVKKITTQREGTSILVLVNLYLARRGATGSFEYDVPVPDSVNEVRFGQQKALIWKRGSQPATLKLDTENEN